MRIFEDCEALSKKLSIQRNKLSDFKIIWNSDYFNRPLNTRRANLGKTLGSARHKILIKILVERREALQMSQSVLAEKLGQYQSFVARLESGQRRVDVIEFLKISEILKFDTRDALDMVQKTRSD
jgi:ribosome-binding protein aMBF1 (putative translation factor)